LTAPDHRAIIRSDSVNYQYCYGRLSFGHGTRSMEAREAIGTGSGASYGGNQPICTNDSGERLESWRKIVVSLLSCMLLVSCSKRGTLRDCALIQANPRHTSSRAGKPADSVRIRSAWRKKSLATTLPGVGRGQVDVPRLSSPHAPEPPGGLAKTVTKARVSPSFSSATGFTPNLLLHH